MDLLRNDLEGRSARDLFVVTKSVKRFLISWGFRKRKLHSYSLVRKSALVREVFSELDGNKQVPIS